MRPGWGLMWLFIVEGHRRGWALNGGAVRAVDSALGPGGVRGGPVRIHPHSPPFDCIRTLCHMLRRPCLSTDEGLAEADKLVQQVGLCPLRCFYLGLI